MKRAAIRAGQSKNGGGIAPKGEGRASQTQRNPAPSQPCLCLGGANVTNPLRRPNTLCAARSQVWRGQVRDVVGDFASRPFEKPPTEGA